MTTGLDPFPPGFLDGASDAAGAAFEHAEGRRWAMAFSTLRAMTKSTISLIRPLLIERDEEIARIKAGFAEAEAERDRFKRVVEYMSPDCPDGGTRCAGYAHADDCHAGDMSADTIERLARERDTAIARADNAEEQATERLASLTAAQALDVQARRHQREAVARAEAAEAKVARLVEAGDALMVAGYHDGCSCCDQAVALWSSAKSTPPPTDSGGKEK